MSSILHVAIAIALVFSEFLLTNTFAATLPNNNTEKNNAALYVLGWTKELDIISLSTNQHTYDQSMVAGDLMGVAVSNNTIYTIAYDTPGAYFWAYDILLGKWRAFGALPDFPIDNVWTLVAVKDKLIGIGARRVFEYDPRVKGAKWVDVGGTPQPVSSPCAVNINNKIYFFGGNGMSRSDDAGRHWTKLASLSQQLAIPACAPLGNDTIVITGGVSGASKLDSVHAYNIPNDVWLMLPSMLKPRSGHSSVELPGGNLLVCGGIGDNNPSQDCEEFDPEAHKWVVSKYVLNQPRKYFGMVVAPIA